MIKKLLTFLGINALWTAALAVIAMADTVEIEVESSDGYDASVLCDDSFSTTDYYMAGTVITVRSETPMDYLYILWDTEPGEWTLKTEDGEVNCGEHAFLHELVKLPASSGEASITISADNTYIAEIYGISNDVPSWVQDWQDPYEEADILLISTHSDDEVLFFGGIIPNYVNGGNYRVQVAYMCDFYLTEPYRRHELLNGLWTMGVTHYPQLGKFEDLYSEDYETALSQYDYDAVVEYMAATIRKFKPQVVVGQDFAGEYGHGGHMICAQALADALEITEDAESYPDSAMEYGTWDVPKAYFHLYGENQIELDARVPLEDFGGKTALEIAKEAYAQHLSQQWMWFYVDDGYDENGDPDGYEYSCTKFGLFRTLVGYDTGNDLMEHLTSYDEQEKEAAENETEETVAAAGGEETTLEETAPQGAESGTRGAVKIVIIVLAAVVAAVLCVMIGLMIYVSYKKKKEAERRARRARQRRSRQR